MPNYITDDTDLFETKVDRRPVPPGESETKFWTAADGNDVETALDNIRDWIRGGGTFYGLTGSAADPAPSGITNYVWLKTDGTLWLTFNGVATEIGSGGGGSGTVGPGTVNQIAKFTGATTVDDSIISDDGSVATVTGALVTTGTAKLAGGETYVVSNAISGQYSTDTDDAQLRLNFHGYQDGVTRFRDTVIYNGKGSALVTVDGSASNVNLAANLNVNGGNVTILSGALVTIGSATSFTNGNAVTMSGPLDHDGTTVGFYGTAPIAKQTGVAVTAAAIHAALVALGLISA